MNERLTFGAVGSAHPVVLEAQGGVLKAAPPGDPSALLGAFNSNSMEQEQSEPV